MSSDSSLSGMSAETGYDLDEEVAPLRISGFLALLCGLLSSLSLIAMPMAAFSLAAVVFGLFALRKSDSASPPVGVTPAKIGIVLAILFGSCGIIRPMARTMIVGGQAEQFAREYLKLVGSGEFHYAMELQKEHYNRYLETMPLDVYYARSEAAVQAAEEFRESSLNQSLVSVGPDAEWEVAEPTRVYGYYGRNLVDVVLKTYRSNSPTPFKVRFIMEYKISKDDGALEWHIDSCVSDRDRIVAESIL